MVPLSIYCVKIFKWLLSRQNCLIFSHFVFLSTFKHSNWFLFVNHRCNCKKMFKIKIWHTFRLVTWLQRCQLGFSRVIRKKSKHSSSINYLMTTLSVHTVQNIIVFLYLLCLRVFWVVNGINFPDCVGKGIILTSKTKKNSRLSFSFLILYSRR